MTVPYTFATNSNSIPLANLDSNFAALGNTTNITYTAPVTNAVAQTVTNKLSQIISVEDFGAVGDWNGTKGTNNTTYIQNAINYGISLGTDFTLYFPQGNYLSDSLTLGNGSGKGTIRVSVCGVPNASILTSTVTGQNPFLNIPIYWGYGAGGCNWVFKDLIIQAQTSGNGYGIYFASLNYQIIIQDCVILSFYDGIHALGCISPRIVRTDVGYCSNNGIYFGISSTGNSGLDQPTSNTRVLQCYIFNNKWGINLYGQQSVVRDCIFQTNSTYALSGAGDFSLIDGNWFEGTSDVIYGEMVDVTISNNIGIASSPSSPLFVSVGNSFNPATNNKCMRLATGEYNNRYSNFIFSQISNNIQAVTQFTGINKTFSSVSASYSEIITDTSSAIYSSVYSLGDPSSLMTAWQITETYSGANYIYEGVIVSFIANAINGVSARYIVPSGGELSVYSSPDELTSSISSTRFYLYRDGSTGNLGWGWANASGSTTAITFSVRPLANFSSNQIPYGT